MLFSSPIFIFLFLPLVLTAHLLLPWRLKNGLLLVASLVFYAWGEGFYLWIMLFSITANYLFGLAIDGCTREDRARWWLAGAVITNLALLGWFKYANFAVENLNVLLTGLDLRPIVLDPVHLPLGISFFTFQALSYVVDVYRREVPAQRRLGNFGLYVASFPQLVAGPIVRYHDVAAQIDRRVADAPLFVSGIRRFVVGLAKKMLIANPLGEVADQIFGLPSSQLGTSTAWLGIVSYTLQIYFDFSAYSDMAIGLGRMLGFRFLENFNYPYVARSIQEFWRRWHISLSNWFRDYLYIPLGGNRVRPPRIYLNLVVVFLLCGLWHGASWNFIWWGLLHGLFLVLERLGLSQVLKRLPLPVSHLYVLAVVMTGWVLFRAEDLPQAVHWFSTLAGAGGTVGVSPNSFITNEVLLALLLGTFGAAPVVPRVRALVLRRLSTGGRRLGYGVIEALAGSTLFVLSAAYLAAGTYNPFIYFRF
jgi:alginate O-acetyltransferase complex protein AlgI